MDRIFSEIKKAIEEEMRNAEAGQAPPERRQGGRRAQEYAEWLKEEQERLRGPQQAQPLEDVSVETSDWERSQRERDEASTRRHEERRQRRSQDGTQRRQQRSQDGTQRRQPQPQQLRSTEYERSEQRHRRQTDSAYSERQPRGTEMRRRVHRLLTTQQGLRQAFLMREIVSKPVSLREPDDHLIT